MNMTPMRELALEYVEALRGRVTDRDLSVVLSPATCGEEFSAIHTAVAVANLYEFDLPAELNARAEALLAPYPDELDEFHEMLSASPSARGVKS